MRPIVWLGNTKKNLMAFPEEVIHRIGYKLQLMQSGLIPTDTKPFKGVGSGVYEIALHYDKEAYRCVQALQLGEKIYILHVFHKKSKEGIATPKQDVDLIRKRYNEAKEIEKDDRESTSRI
jgi:phage-related protein